MSLTINIYIRMNIKYVIEYDRVPLVVIHSAGGTIKYPLLFIIKPVSYLAFFYLIGHIIFNILTVTGK